MDQPFTCNPLKGPGSFSFLPHADDGGPKHCWLYKLLQVLGSLLTTHYVVVGLQGDTKDLTCSSGEAGTARVLLSTALATPLRLVWCWWLCAHFPAQWRVLGFCDSCMMLMMETGR